MEKVINTVLISALLFVILLLLGYKLYQNRMTSVLYTINKIILKENGSENINVEINIDSEAEKILKKAKYAGKLIVSKGNYYEGICYFDDGITGTILISKNYGDIRIIVADDFSRGFIFRNGYDEVWLKYIKSKIEGSKT